MAELDHDQGELDKLFDDAMKGHWDKVIETYRKSPRAREAKITKADETALHLAVADGETKFALQLINVITDPATLSIQNERGDTPLHLAAALGDLIVCIGIMEKNPQVVTIRNSKGETPLFLAARYGKKKAFLYLHSINQEEKHLKRENGDTILHVTIAGDYFGLAIKIMKYYPGFVNSLNMDGLTPLHILASKSNAFRSSTSLGLFDRILYYCLVVDELEETQVDIAAYRKTAKGQKEISEQFPENYQTCMNFVKLLKPERQEIKLKWGVQKEDNSADVENPQNNGSSSVQDKGKEKSESKSKSDENNLEQVSILSQGLGKLKKRSFPPNYDSFVLFFKLMVKALLIVLGVGIARIKEMESKKKLHLRAKLVMDEMVTHTKTYKSYGNTGLKPKDIMHRPTDEEERLFFGKTPEDQEKEIDQTEASQDPREIKGDLSESDSSKDHKKPSDPGKSGVHDTPILIAAKTGTAEMVEKILDTFPVAIHDLDSEGKNVVLLAVENRQPHVYNLLLNRKVLKESVFSQVDNQGNSALHLAAQLGEHKPWLIPGSALQMQWEIKWYEYVRDSMPPSFFPLYNKHGKTPNDVFCGTHEALIKDGSDWLTKTSESCSVVAALVATVAFTASSTVPGGVNSESGIPTLKDKPAFNAFAISALVALCFSVTGLVFFLSILTSRYQEKDFASDLPRKLLLGLTSLFASIASMLVSFCAGHIFVLNQQLRFVAYPLYAALCFPVTFFAFAQLSLYFDLIMAIFKKVPQRSYRMFPH